MKQMTKKKFISSIVAYAFLFVLLSCLVGYGAWAILNANFNLGGNISFEANNILATISAGQVSGGTLTDSASKLQAITINTTDNGHTAMQTWSGLDLHFNDNGDDVTITFTITNNHTEKALLVEVGEITGTKTNATVSVTADGESAESVVIAANNDSVEYVVTFSVTEKDKSASITDFSIPISMENAEGHTVTITYDSLGNIPASIYYSVNGGEEQYLESGENTILEDVVILHFSVNRGAWSFESSQGFGGPVIIDGERFSSAGEKTMQISEDTTITISDIPM